LAKRGQVRQGGDVPVALRRRRRHAGPNQTPLRVTTLPQATAHTTVAVDLRRWPVERCSKELKGVVGLGRPQGTKEAARVERAGGIALRAYLLWLRLRAKPLKPGRSWSAFRPKPQFAWELGARPLKRVAQQEVRKEVRRRLTTKEVHLRLAA
jgi:hypothetical protein